MENVEREMKNKLPDRRCIVLIGLPGSGKSTYAKDFLKNLSEDEKGMWKIISRDDILMMYGKHKFGEELNYSQIWQRLNEEDQAIITKSYYMSLHNAVDAGINLIIDKTNLNAKTRRKEMKKIKTPRFPKNAKMGYYHFEAVVFDVEHEELIKRLKKRELETGKLIPADVIFEMKERFEFPSEDEEFKTISII